VKSCNASPLAAIVVVDVTSLAAGSGAVDVALLAKGFQASEVAEAAGGCMGTDAGGFAATLAVSSVS
jgi:hypothetical protein